MDQTDEMDPQVPLPRMRPRHKGDQSATPLPRSRPDAGKSDPSQPSGPDFGSPELGMPSPEDPHPHAQYPMEDQQHLSDMLRQALAENHGITGPLGSLGHDQQSALALALQNDPTNPAWTPGPKNPVTSAPYMLPPGFDPAAAFRAWLQQSQHPMLSPDVDGRVFRTTEANI